MLDSLPSSVQGLARKMPAEIRDAEDNGHAVVDAFDDDGATEGPKATATITGGLDQPLASSAFPAEH